MSAAVPESDLTPDQLLKLSNFRRDLADALDEALLTVGGGGGGAGYTLYKATDFGTTDTPANTRLALLAAATAAEAAGGGLVFLPAGTYFLERDGGNSWCIDWPFSRVSLVGDPGRTRIKMTAGMADASISMFRFDARFDFVVRDIIFDGNWGNRVTKIEAGSHLQTMSPSVAYTMSVGDTTNMATSGVVTVRTKGDVNEYVTYTGKTLTTLTGCLGGTAILRRDDPVVYQNSAAGLNHTTQGDPKSHALMLRGCGRVLIERCEFYDLYGDAIWLGMPFDDDLWQPSIDIRITNCRMDTLARNAISFGAGVERITIDHNYMANFWTCGIDSEPQGQQTSNRDIWIHHNYVEPWPIWPGGGQAQALGVVAAVPSGYNQNTAARNWRITDNVFLGWCAINNAIDVDFSRNEVRTRFDYLGKADVSAVNASTDTLTSAAHGLKTGDGPIRLYTDVANGLPVGVTTASGSTVRSVEVWLIRVDANNVKLATTFANALAGTAIDITTAGSGTMYLQGPTCISPIYIDHVCDEIRVTNNYVYDNSKKSFFTGEANHGAITVANYPANNVNLQPAGVVIENNDIHAHKGLHGVYVNAQGGFSIGDGTAKRAPSAGTATSVTLNTVTDTGAAWTVNEWIGWQVIMGGAVGLIVSNTATVLTLSSFTGATTGWFDALGEVTPTPAAGAYRITSTSGYLVIKNNRIDCTAYADHTAGGNGVYLFNDRAGGRIEVTGNKIKNASGWGVFVAGATNKGISHLEISDNKVWDDQGAAATTSAAIRFSDAQSLTSVARLIMRNNTAEDSITPLSNVAAGTWLLSDGYPAQWTGYGTPEAFVTAPIGSTYVRLDGGAGTTIYVKESGTGNTGWTAK